MFLARLHALSWHRLNRLGQIDLGPLSADNLARPRRREYRKFQRQRRNRFALLQLFHEDRDCIIGHRFLMARDSFVRAGRICAR